MSQISQKVYLVIFFFFFKAWIIMDLTLGGLLGGRKAILSLTGGPPKKGPRMSALWCSSVLMGGS